MPFTTGFSHSKSFSFWFHLQISQALSESLANRYDTYNPNQEAFDTLNHEVCLRNWSAIILAIEIIERFCSFFLKVFLKHTMWCPKGLYLVDTGRKLNVHKMFRRRPDVFWTFYVRSIYVLCVGGILVVILFLV